MSIFGKKSFLNILNNQDNDEYFEDEKIVSMQSDNRQMMMQSIRRIEAELSRLKALIGVAEVEISNSQEEFIKGSQEQIIEGVFNGEAMISGEGKVFSVPANYASKSKLVEGDILKLTINPMGGFIFKQIRPIERRKVRGKLHLDEREMQYYLLLDKKNKWKVLTASVTYFKGNPGDEIIGLIPRESLSQWAAVEQIINSVENISDDLLESM